MHPFRSLLAPSCTRPRTRREVVAIRRGSRSAGRTAAWTRACTVFVLLTLSVVAFAQDETADALAAAQAAAADARASGVVASIDQPAWRRAETLARQALAAHPGDLETLRFLARLYGEVLWYIRAWESWQAYLGAGGTLLPAPEGSSLPADAEMFATAGTELGFARYVVGDAVTAIDYYAAVLDVLPDDAEALRWLGRIHLEQGRPREALPYWERLAELEPDDPGVAYYVGLARERIAVGEDASRAFQDGIDAYESGDLETALGAFERAIAANAGFIQAHVWAGRSALELGRPVLAARHWADVLELDPQDGRAQYFLDLANDQIRWGVQPALDFYNGQAAYEGGDVEAARELFERASVANPDYLEAWVWAARTAQELGDPAAAIDGWNAVLRLDPDDERAQYFLTLAEQQVEFGVEAGAAYAEGVRAYQVADLVAAEAAFRRAVEADSEFPEAWGWLGRIAFDQARYADAAEAYGRAAELDPENRDYAFFLDESRRLAQE